MSCLKQLSRGEIMTENKKVWSLNPIERMAYKCLTQAFVGAYMAKDIICLENGEDKE